jgi:hypothetical protein
MTYILIAAGCAAGLYVLWKIFTICLSLFTPVEVKGRSYLYAQLDRIGAQTLALSPEIITAAVQLAELDATDPASKKINYKVFCEALDEYAAAIKNKLQNEPISSDAGRSWEAIQKMLNSKKAQSGTQS